MGSRLGKAVPDEAGGMDKSGKEMNERFDGVNTPAEVRSLLLFAALNGTDTENLRKRILSGFEVDAVKQNPKRKVYRLRCPDGTELYLKLFAGQNLLQSFFRFYARQEYQAARTLEKAGLPMIHYLAWGRLRRGGFCLSEGIPQAVSARQYFFETLVRDPERQRVFLEQLTELTGKMFRLRIRHPDFHLGNILCSPVIPHLTLADPWGVYPVPLLLKKFRLELCLPWLELYGSVPEAQLLSGLEEAGLASDEASADSLLHEALERHSRMILRQRDKLNARILSGKSKFATEIELPEGRCSFRHTEWFAAPEKLELSPRWQAVEYKSEAESRPVWLESFLRVPPMQNPPLARLITKNGASILFYDRVS